MRTLGGGSNVARAFFCGLWWWPIEKSKNNCAYGKAHFPAPSTMTALHERPGGNVMQEKGWVRFIRLSVIVISLVCATNLCLAQLDRGTISGVVTDPSGSAVVGARVTVTNNAMGTQ